jgi:hypothetical protein
MPCMKSLLRALLPMLMFASGGAASAADLTSYYFPESERCTLVLDFQPRRADLAQLAKEARSLSLAKDLLREFKANGSEKCPEAKDVRLLAVFVPGTDNYGRPNFGSRVNLLRLEGPRDKVLQGADADFKTIDEIGGLTATVF